MSMVRSTPQVPEWTIGDRLRKARESCGLDTAELAGAMQTSRATVYNYESGATTRLKPYIVKSWALATGVPLDWLQTGELASNPNPPGDSMAAPKKGGGPTAPLLPLVRRPLLRPEQIAA